MKLFSLFVGTLAVAFFLGSYQLRERRGIILFNVISRVLYIAQYVLLGEFIGAVMDISAIPSSAVAARKENTFVKRFKIPLIIAVNLLIVALGLAFYANIFSLLPIFGVLFETAALWFTNERTVRLVSLFGAPFWLSYNFICGAYASAVGNVLAIISILVALYRYRVKKQKPATAEPRNEEKEIME